MATDLLAEFRELMRGREGINHRLNSLGMAVAAREDIQWPATLEGQALLVSTLRRSNSRLSAELDKLDRDTMALDQMLDADPRMGAMITPAAETRPRTAWVQ